MKTGDIKVTWVIVALLTSLVLFWGLRSIYINYLTEKPIIDKVEQMSFVEKANIEKDGSQNCFEVEIKQPGNVKDEYNQIEKIIESKFKPDDYRLELIDKGNESLNSFSDEIQPIIYEAIAKNNFLWLNEQISAMAKERSFTYKSFIDEERLYIQIQDKGFFIYQIVERPSQVQNANS